MDNSMEERFNQIEQKLDLILEILQEDVKKNCEKMGSHIDFVENVYDNVKNPLNFVCNKINNLTGTTESKTLENVKK